MDHDAQVAEADNEDLHAAVVADDRVATMAGRVDVEAQRRC